MDRAHSELSGMQTGEIRQVSVPATRPQRAGGAARSGPQDRFTGSPPPPEVMQMLKLDDVKALRAGVASLCGDLVYGPAAQLALKAADGVPGAFGQTTVLKAALLFPQDEQLPRFMLGSFCEGAGPAVFARLGEDPAHAEAARFAVELAGQSGPGALHVYQTALDHLTARTSAEKLELGKAALARIESEGNLMGDDGPIARAMLGKALMPLLAEQPGCAEAAALGLKMGASTHYDDAAARAYAAVLEHPRLDDLQALAEKAITFHGDDAPARVLVDEQAARTGCTLAQQLWDSCHRKQTHNALCHAALQHPRVDTPAQLVAFLHTALARAGEYYYGACREDQTDLGRAGLLLLQAQPSTCQAASQGLQDMDAVASPNEGYKVLLATLVAAAVPPEKAPFVYGVATQLSVNGRVQLYESLSARAAPTPEFYRRVFDGLKQPADRMVGGRELLAGHPVARFLDRVEPEQQVAWAQTLLDQPLPEEPDAGLSAVALGERLLAAKVGEEDKLRPVVLELLSQSIHVGDPQALARQPLKGVLAHYEKAARQAIEVRRLQQGSPTSGLREDRDSLQLPGVRLRKR